MSILPDLPNEYFAGPGYYPHLIEPAKRIVASYMSETGTIHPPNGARNAVIEILATGQATEVELLAINRRFGQDVRRTYSNPAMRMGARQFFCRDSGAWNDWKDGSPIAEDQPTAFRNSEEIIAYNERRRKEALGV